MLARVKDRHIVLAVLLTTYLLISSMYRASVPPFEGPDAYYHFAVTEHIARTGSLPPKDHAVDQPWRQMIFHAPLYYMLAAGLIAPIDTSDFLQRYPPNPHAQIGEPHAADNENFTVHVDYGWQKTDLAIRIVRFLSMLLGLVTLLAVYVLARQVIPSRPDVALLSVLVVMLIPQFEFMVSIISNDNLLVAMSTLVIAMLAWMLRRGVTLRRVILLSSLLALNALAKASGMALYPVAGLALLWMGYRNRWSKRRWVLYFATGLLMWVVVDGWWYGSNWQQLGDPFATSRIARTTGARADDIHYIGELRGLYFSFWGLFGWFNIIAPLGFYGWTAVLLATAGIGLLSRRTLPGSAEDRIMIVLAGLLVMMVIGAWWRFNLSVAAAQGRLWFPLLGVLGLLIALGLTQWRYRLVPVVLLVGMGVATVAFPMLLIAPHYQSPEQVEVDQWAAPSDAVPVALREPWQAEACLILWVQPPRVDASEIVLDVTMAGRCPLTGYWSYFLHLYRRDTFTCEDAAETVLFQIDSMPGGGDLPLPALKPGHVVHEQYRVPLPAGVTTGDNLMLHTGFYDAGGSFIRMLIDQPTLNGDVASISECGHDTIELVVPSS